MSSLSKELVFIILQFLNEENYKETIYKLEKESGHFFDMKYFEEKVMNGEWEESENYLSGFTKMIDNRYSMKMYFEMRKQKYLEALDRKGKARALEILVNDLKVFKTYNEDLYKEMTCLLTLENFRDNEQLSKYGDIKSSRKSMLVEVKKLIEANPRLNDKLVFPSFKPSRLRTLLNQRTSSAVVIKPTPLSIQPPTVNPFTLMMNNANGASTSSAAPAAPQSQSLLAALKHPITPSAPGFLDSPNNDEQLPKRLRAASQSSEARNLPVARPQQAPPPLSLDDLTRTIFCTLIQGATVTSMDFHPSLHSLLVVGTVTGEISIWEVGRREKPISKPFSIWNSATCSVLFQAAYAKDSTISITRVSWSADGRYLGVAFTKHLVHVYVYQAPNELKEHMEVDAHVGSVNDLAFSSPSKQLTVVTCGDDKLIRVWDLTGRNLFNFEGHQAAVYSICLNLRETIEYIFSSSVDGKIKAWLLDNSGTKVDYDADGKFCTTMLYSSDGYRLFSSGTTKTGVTFLVEWEEHTGTSMVTFMPPPPHSTCLAFHPQDNNMVAIGKDDSSIHIYNVQSDQVKFKLTGHGRRITGLAFSTLLNLMVSSGADGQLVFWRVDTWKEKKSMKLYSPEERPLTGNIQVQFHSNEIHLLACHRQVIRIYDALRMELIRQWVPKADLFGSISCATYSCNSKLVYAAFTDGNIVIFNAATLVMRCRIAPSVYLLSNNLLHSQNVHAVSVVANPQVPDQFAVGLSNGAVKVIEPKDFHQGNNNALYTGGWVATFRQQATETTACMRSSRRRALSSSGMVEETLSDANSVSVVANPQKPDQFAVGLSNGAVKIIEPKDFHQGNNNALHNGMRSSRRRELSSGMVDETPSDTNSGANKI
ncbi:hypothetical protein PIB30_044375 [Stylosanthes scabra]|uniref:CTLH domain-containing protein n=1 Tax=Stylosanthes scabra TaxID=79078 RepID=A0ABU6VHQ2_9FABA|nr:hypothetical protein [Stylosanthes scabra]